LLSLLNPTLFAAQGFFPNDNKDFPYFRDLGGANILYFVHMHDEPGRAQQQCGA